MSWVGIARQNDAKTRSLLSVNEDFERNFNAARTPKSQFATGPAKADKDKACDGKRLQAYCLYGETAFQAEHSIYFRLKAAVGIR